MKSRGIVGLAALLLTSSIATAAVSDEEFETLRGDMGEMSERLDTLAEENDELREQNTQLQKANETSGAAVTETWTDRIGISGDFRYRYENIDEEGGDERNRSRIRARAEIKAALPNDIEVGIGMASGGEDPVSANQTLGGGGSSKGVNLDLAYATWTGLGNTSITGGKFKNPLFRPGGTQLLWDSDWRPEGLTTTWDNGTFFGTALGSWLEGDSRNGTEFAWGVQAGIKAALAGLNLTFGAGYYDIGVQGQDALFGDVDDFLGNSFTCTDPVTPAGCTYDINYEEVEAFVEAATELAGLPLVIFAEFVQNQDADNNDTGYVAGVKLGKAKDTGKWEIGYAYKDVEADAVLGLLADSDYGGGGTDYKGHKISAGYGLNKNTALKATYFINEIEQSSVNPLDFDRLQLDIQFKFK